MATSQGTVIETRDLTKRYGDLIAVNALNLRIRPGEVYGVLGPNGSGKTTTILMLLGLTEPSAGSARVLGVDPMRRPLAVKARVGYLPEQVGFYEGLTAHENLNYVAKLNGLRPDDASSRIGQSLQQMGLGAVSDRPVATFSRGMRQRLGLAEVLLKKPRVIILDEPTLGLDPEAAQEFLQTIKAFKGEEITVLLASHLLYQVQAVCDRVGLFHNGQMVLEGTVPELALRVLGGAYRVRLEAEGPDLAETLERQSGVVSVVRSDQGAYKVEAQRDIREDVAQAVVQAGGRLRLLALEEPSLDEVYAQYFRGEGTHVGAEAA